MIRRLVTGFVARRQAAVARLTALYAAFAGLAMGANLLVQWLVVDVAKPWELVPAKLLVVPALAAGTGVGLLVKYPLDKRFIFRDRAGGAVQHAKKFSLYALMGLSTTAIFWGAELLARLVSSDERAMFAGGAMGLLIGYVVKYRLDRRFVFVQASNEAAAALAAEAGAEAPPEPQVALP